MMKGLSHALRGIGGEYEAIRVLGALGILAYIVCANAFVAWHMRNGHPFDVTAYCIAFPSGLGAAIAAVAGSVAIKDRNVASAKVIQQTGAVPTPALDGARVPQGDPPPVGES